MDLGQFWNVQLKQLSCGMERKVDCAASSLVSESLGLDPDCTTAPDRGSRSKLWKPPMLSLAHDICRGRIAEGYDEIRHPEWADNARLTVNA